jgi:hypothetical protein
MAEAGKGSRHRQVNKEAFEAGWDRIFGNPKKDLESPCVEICQFDYVKGVCIGCHRTLDEIGEWINCGSEEKKRILANVEERKKDVGL